MPSALIGDAGNHFRRHANKNSGLHKILHCVGTWARTRWIMLESTASFPAIFFAAIIGVIVFIALSQVLLDPHE
jgi:hypothetical protein